MYIDYKLKQDSEAWHEIKNGKISGTRAKSVMVKKDISSAAIFDEIMSERNTTFKHTEGFITDAMKRGIELEPLAIKEVEKQTGVDFYEAGLLIRNENHIHSPDGISGCETIGLEVKCPSAKVHNSYVRSGVLPLEYVYQVVNYFAMSESIETVYFASYNPDYKLLPLFVLGINRKSVIFTSKKDSDTIENLVQTLNQNVDNLINEIDEETIKIKNFREIKLNF